MIIEIKNFGPIEYLKFDINKDLHLIYGHNAIGKSYATYCIYCVLKNIKNKALLDRDSSLYFRDFIEDKVKALQENTSIDITKDYHEIIEKVLSSIFLGGLQNSLSNTFSSLKNIKNRYSNVNYEIVVSISENEKLIFASSETGDIHLIYELPVKKMEIVEKSTKSTKLSLFTNEKIEFGKPNEQQFAEEFSNFAINAVNKILRNLDSNIRDIYYLPASRSGLYQALNTFTPIIAELTQNRFFIQNNRSIELPSLSEPVSDYFIDLSTIDKKNVNKEFEAIINLLQAHILKGKVVYDDEAKKIIYQPDHIDLELNLSEASSMVAEISPIVIYLKHIINFKYSSLKSVGTRHFYDSYYDNGGKKTKGCDIIFIEEPEAHLHPEVQVALIEIFAKLSALKLKIFITSHSNYMFNKLNNLLLSKSINKDKVAVYHLIKNDKGSTQDSEMVVTEDGINDANFQEVSENLYNERMKIYE